MKLFVCSATARQPAVQEHRTRRFRHNPLQVMHKVRRQGTLLGTIYYI